MNHQKSKGYPADSRTVAVRIVLVYAVIGGLWILFSDRLLSVLVTDPALLTRLQTAKGWFYVGATGLLLYFLINRYLLEISRAAMERWKSEEKFQALFHSAPVSIWEVDLSTVKADLDDLAAHGVRDFSLYFEEQPDFVLNSLQKIRILDVNEMTLYIFTANSKPLLLGVLDRIFMPESIRSFREMLITIAEKRPQFEAELGVLTLGGERKNILVTLSIPSDPEKFATLPVCVTDITERKRTEERLLLLESAVQQAGESITITTAELDPPGPQIIFVNPAFTRITGYTADEVRGKTPRLLHGPKTDRAILDRMRQALYHRQTFQAETVNYRKDGTEFIMEWYVAPIMNEKFQVTHFVAIQRDITDRKRTEEEIRKLNEELSRRVAELEASAQPS